LEEGGGRLTGSVPFRCLACGTCCRWPGLVYLSRGDLGALARHLDIAEEAFLDRYARLAPNRAEIVLAEREDGACVFLEGDACAVYPARPAQCRDYPVRWRVEEPCPGQDA
jgi:Fe-S-cluster containining protein